MIRYFGQLLAASLLLSGAAQAATQGSQGSTSTGTVGISATVPNRAQITGLTDMTFAPTDLTVLASSAENVCVWSNTSLKKYNITATGSGASNAFTLAAAALTIPYSVEWAATTGQTSGTGLTSGTPLTAQVSTATKPSCSSGPVTTSSLVVKIAATDLQSMVGSTAYTGTLTLVVAPE